MKRILVSGVGRSATTLVYRQIARAIQCADLNANFRYEPYLWNVRSPSTKGQSFALPNLNHSGVAVHVETPLFLGEPQHDKHDSFVDELFDAPLDSDPSAKPEAYLAKIIRGTGRLRGYLERFDDLKVVICLRNPLDTVNSSLSVFSFFGEEFHSDDRDRFKSELIARSAAGHPVPGLDPNSLPTGRRSVEWAVAWAWAFTHEALQIADAYPDRVKLVFHERLVSHEAETFREIAAFTELDETEIQLNLGRSAGPRTDAISLTVADIDYIRPFNDRYMRTVLAPRFGIDFATACLERQETRLSQLAFRLPIAGADAQYMGRSMHVMQMLGSPSAFVKIMQRPQHPTDLAGLIDTVYSGDNAPIERPVAWPSSDGDALKKGRTFGVAITAYNSGILAVEAVLSCLQQTLPFDEIVVVDDASTDDTPALLAELEALYSQIKVVRLDTNLGPASARHLGYTHLTTDFVTQLDGDDLFWPTKLEEEARVIDGDLRRVAFSDILLAKSPEHCGVESPAHLNNTSSHEAYRSLIARARPIPRDLTFARASYFEAGGYDLLGRLYEDWEFKLRLAALPGQSWHASNAYAGTVYNRANPGLSERDLNEQARALLTIFLRGQSADLLPKADVLSAFDGAMKRVSKRPLICAARRWLEQLTQRPDDMADRLAEFAHARWLSALSWAEFDRLFSCLGKTGDLPPLGPPDYLLSGPDLDWEVLSGYQPVSATGAAKKQLFRHDGNLSTLEVNLAHPVPAFGLKTYLSSGTQTLRIGVNGRTFEKQVSRIAPGDVNLITIPIGLETGRSEIEISIVGQRDQTQNNSFILGGLFAAELVS